VEFGPRPPESQGPPLVGLMRRTPLRPGKPLRRKTRLNPVNTKRRQSEVERAYGEVAYRVWGSMQPCCACGRVPTQSSPNHNAHIKPRGEPPSGMGRKAGKEWLVTLCSDCHEQYHKHGEKAFELHHKIDLDLMAAARWCRWRERDGQG